MKTNIFRSNLTIALFAAVFFIANSTVHAQNEPGKITVSNAKTRTGSVTYVVATQSMYEVDISGKAVEEPGDFAGVEQRCAAAKHPLVFAMNGGKCNKSLQPLGLLIKGLVKYKDFVWPDDKVFSAVGPSAIFAIDRNDKVQIVPANKFKVGDDLATYRLALQSGVILLNKGFMNPVIVRATATQVCNGIGIKPNGDIVLAIADSKISLREFAVFFEEQHCNDAMLLDEGTACQWYTPGSQKKPGAMGEILVVRRK